MPVLRSTATKKPKGYSKKLRDSASTSKVTKEIVKQMIDKKLDDAIEDKVLDYNFQLSISQTSADPAGQTQMDINNQFCLTVGSQNQIVQGVAQGGRVGNKIRIKAGKLKFMLSPAFKGSTNTLPQPQIVRCVLYYDRLDETNSSPSPFAPILAGSTETFQSGSTDSMFQGNQHDITRTFNDDRFKVMWQKDYKIGFSNYIDPVNTPFQNFQNNDALMSRYEVLDYTKYIIKHVRWNDNNLGPSTRGLYFYAYCVNMTDLPASLPVPMRPINLKGSMQIIYEDA